MNFVPDQTEAKKVPYFEDATRSEGWQGYSTTKNENRLKAEITDAISRLGGFVSGFRKGAFIIDRMKRQGFQVFYSLQSPNGLVAGRMDIAALPVKNDWDSQKLDKSLRMALYMLKISLDGMWFFQQLSPGYAPLMPFMIADERGNTVSQLWAESSTMKNLLPPPDADFIDAEVEE